MANESTSTTLSGLFTAIQQASMFEAQERAIVRPLVREYNLTNQPGKTAQVPIYPRLTTGALTSGEGTDASNTQISTTTKSITTDEIAVMTTLTDTARDSAVEDVASSIGRIFGETLAKKVDEDLVSLFAGASQKVGDFSTELTPDLILQAVAKLRSNNVYGPYHCVVSPNAAFNLKKVLTNAGYSNSGGQALSDIGNEALRSGFIGQVYGVNIFESAIVGSDNVGDSSSTSTAAVFTPEALGLALKKDITIETQRNASVRGEEVVASMTFGVLELKDEEIIRVECDANASN